MSFQLPEPGTYDVIDVNGRGVLLDSRTGETWLLCSVENDKPFWRPVKWPSNSEKKPEDKG